MRARCGDSLLPGFQIFELFSSLNLLSIFSSTGKYNGLLTLLFPERSHLQGLLRLQRAVRSPEGRQDEPSAVLEHSGIVDYFIQNDLSWQGRVILILTKFGILINPQNSQKHPK